MEQTNEFEDLIKSSLSETIDEIAKDPERFSAAPGAFTRNRKWGIKNTFNVFMQMDCHNLYSNILKAGSTLGKAGYNFYSSRIYPAKR